MSCIAHSLNLVVGGALVKKRRTSSGEILMTAAQIDADADKALQEFACEDVDEFMEASRCVV